MDKKHRNLPSVDVLGYMQHLESAFDVRKENMELVTVTAQKHFHEMKRLGFSGEKANAPELRALRQSVYAICDKQGFFDNPFAADS